VDIRDYLLDADDLDWQMLLADWAWLLPEELTVWFANRFGDVFFAASDGSINMLDVGIGSVSHIAKSRERFEALVDEDGNGSNWLMIPLVDRLVQAGITLRPGTCYSYTILPVLGGQYTVENSWVSPIHEHYGLLASMHQQIKSLPDGTCVRLKITE
jgi:hypothetical protein